MKSTLCLLLWGCLLLPTLRAQPLLTLPDALALALENSFAVQINRLQQDSLRNQLTYGNAGFLPLLSAQARRQYSVNDTRQKFLDGRNNVIDNANTDVLNASVDAAWTLFNGGAMFVAYQSLQQLQRTGTLGQQATREALVADVTVAYYNVVQQNARVRAFENTLVISGQRLQLAQDNYEVGTGTKAEYLAAQADRNADRSALLNEQRQLVTAKVDLNELLVRPPLTPFQVADTLVPIETLPALPDLRARLTTRSTQLQTAELRQTLAALRTRQQQSNYWPVLAVFGSYGYNRQNSEAGFLLQNRQVGFAYGATARITLYDGFNQRRRIQNARLTEQIRQVETSDLAFALEATVTRLYTDYVNSLDLVRLEEENLEIAEERVAIELDRYRIGVSTPLQLREAQRSTVDAERRLIEASFSAKLAETELLLLTGYLTDRLLP